MTVRIRRAIVALVGVLAGSMLWALSPTASAQQGRSQWDGIYTDAQAARGQALYGEGCAICHGGPLTGTLSAPPLIGGGFTGRWENRPLDDLLTYMQVAMPIISPGGFSRRQNADILAHILKINGVPSGATELSGESAALRAITLLPRPASNARLPPAPAVTLPPPPYVITPVVGAGNGGGRFYTEAQAARGRVAFNRNCAFCHSMDAKLSTPQDWEAPLPRTFGGKFLEKRIDSRSKKLLYPSVFYIFARTYQMPTFNTHAVPLESKADIVAYILQANGYPSGSAELTTDTDAMKQMMLQEFGFEQIFNGRDFSGIKFRLGTNCKSQPEGCASTDPGSVVRIENGTMYCECNVHGYWYTEKKYLNFDLRFDYKFVRPLGWDDSADDSLYQGQGGHFLFVQDPTKETRAVVFDGRHFDMLHIAQGRKGIEDPEALQRVNRPLGQWNSVQIVSKGTQVQAFLNGALISTVADHPDTPNAGHIVVQIEGPPMYWRNVRIRNDDVPAPTGR